MTPVSPFLAESSPWLPVVPTNRIPSLDILRGVALLGILLMNIMPFGMPLSELAQVIRGPHGLSYWLLSLIHVLFEHKMRALFSMLFGAGMLLFLAKRQPSSAMPAPELLVRRQLWLIVFGLINALVLLWPYDILFQYGIVGLLLFPFNRLSARGLLVCAVIASLIYSGKNYWIYQGQRQPYQQYQRVIALEKKHKNLPLTDEQKAAKAAWEAVVKQSQYDPKASQAEIIAMRSDYPSVWQHLLPRIQQMESTAFYDYVFWDVASMMLLGMALFKWGFFSNQLTGKHYLFLALGGLLIGQTAAWLILPAHEARQLNLATFIRTTTLPVEWLVIPFERAFSAVGWASLVILLYRSGVGGWLWKALGALGQMAFTNYLMQTILCTLFFYGYGLGYFGELKFYQLYFVVAEIWLIQLVFSLVWLNFFRFGPLEWIWRSLTYSQRQPMRRNPDAASYPAPTYS